MTLPVPQSALTVFTMLKTAAERGDDCPSNAVLATAMGTNGTAAASAAVALLETAGMIVVERSRASRVVEIVATGKRTRGVIRKPIALKPAPTRRWTTARDATLMQRIPDGADFEQAAASIAGTTGDVCAARFDELRAGMGWQAV